MTIEFAYNQRKKSVIERDEVGIRYSVVINDVEIWHKRVEFGNDRWHRAGGGAFIEASREQDEVVENG